MFFITLLLIILRIKILIHHIIHIFQLLFFFLSFLFDVLEVIIDVHHIPSGFHLHIRFKLKSINQTSAEGSKSELIKRRQTVPPFAAETHERFNG